MTPYVAPLQEIRFVIERVLRAPRSWSSWPAFSELQMDDAAEILEHAARFATEVLDPTNMVGDIEGCTFAAGVVTAPPSYREAYRAFVEGGWPSLACHAEWGGQGLPQLLDAALYEMLLSCNHAWSMYPGLLHGAYATLHAHGSDELRQSYLPKLASGEWLAAMAMTEPQAGSDLGMVRTLAVPQPDGTLKVTGQKIFISGGEHDLTDNIVHLVLCRMPGAEPGSKGLSLALVPKRLPDGTMNHIVCGGIEKKMGIKGSATCQMSYEAATGWLIGSPGRGLATMFVMMNSARLHVALQGLGHLERARQRALAYARQRQQMRPPLALGGAHSQPDSIASHPAMKRVLWRLHSLSAGLRVVAYRIAMLLDEAEHHPDSEARQRAAASAALLTPVVKSFITEHGFASASHALQVFGGYGYVHDYGIEQQVRDARIAMIYEGTNEIQAIDLLMRKVLPDNGANLEALLQRLDDELMDGNAAPQSMLLTWRAGCEQTRLAVRSLTDTRQSDPDRAYRIADDFLSGIGYVLLCWAWIAIARAAEQEDDQAFSTQQVNLARHGFDWLMPEGDMHWRRVMRSDAELPLI